MRVRIGVANATKELDLDVDDAEGVVTGYEKAVDRGDHLFWVTETDGRRHGVVVSAVVYIEFEPEGRKAIGFGSGG